MCVYATAQKSRHWQLLFTISGAIKEMPESWTLVLIYRDKILEETSSSSFSSTFCSCSASTVPFGGDPGLPDTIPKGPKMKTLIITCLFQNYTSVFNKIPDNFGVRKVIDVKFSKSDLLGGRLLLVGRTWHYQFLQTNTESEKFKSVAFLKSKQHFHLTPFLEKFFGISAEYVRIWLTYAHMTSALPALQFDTSSSASSMLLSTACTASRPSNNYFTIISATNSCAHSSFWNSSVHSSSLWRVVE